MYLNEFFIIIIIVDAYDKMNVTSTRIQCTLPQPETQQVLCCLKQATAVACESSKNESNQACSTGGARRDIRLDSPLKSGEVQTGKTITAKVKTTDGMNADKGKSSISGCPIKAIHIKSLWLCPWFESV